MIGPLDGAVDRPSPALAILEYGAAGCALDGKDSGDAHVVAAFPGGALVGVIDGLGHGPEAALAARAAVAVLAATPQAPVEELLARCHEALRRTRGAVISLASFDARASSLTWLGVGNVEAVLARAPPAVERETITLRGGIVGYQLPTLRPVVVPVSPGDTLVLATDGVRSGFHEDGEPAPRSPQALAEAILARHARGSDDALVVVARYLGAGA